MFGERYCPYCHEGISPTALVCKFCRQPLVDELPTLAEAQKLLDQQQARRVALRVPLLRKSGDASVAGGVDSVEKSS
jgi:hypothetical protein